jgi:hypothetical protein
LLQIYDVTPRHAFKLRGLVSLALERGLVSLALEP